MWKSLFTGLCIIHASDGTFQPSNKRQPQRRILSGFVRDPIADIHRQDQLYSQRNVDRFAFVSTGNTREDQEIQLMLQASLQLQAEQEELRQLEQAIQQSLDTGAIHEEQRVRVFWQWRSKILREWSKGKARFWAIAGRLHEIERSPEMVTTSEEYFGRQRLFDEEEQERKKLEKDELNDRLRRQRWIALEKRAIAQKLQTQINDIDRMLQKTGDGLQASGR